MVSVWRLGMTVGYCPRLTEEVRPPGDYRTVATSGWLESPRARGIQRRRRVTSWTTAEPGCSCSSSVLIHGFVSRGSGGMPAHPKA